MFEVDEGDSQELCIDISSAPIERIVILLVTTNDATAQGTIGINIVKQCTTNPLHAH